MQPITAILSPTKPCVASFTWRTTFGKSNLVRPQDGQEVYSVLLMRQRDDCRSSNAMSLTCSGVMRSEWLESQMPSMSPSMRRGPKKAPAWICRVSKSLIANSFLNITGLSVARSVLRASRLSMIATDCL